MSTSTACVEVRSFPEVIYYIDRNIEGLSEIA